MKIIKVGNKIPSFDGKPIKAITGGSEENNIVYSFENQAIKEFVDNVSYTSDYISSQASSYYGLSYANNGSPNGADYSSAAGTLRQINNGKLNSATVSSGVKKLYNNEPGKVGSFSVINNSNLVVNSGTVASSGGVRVIYGSTLKNMRDLGGWTCDGGTVRYGILYRGSELIGTGGGPQMSYADKAMLQNLIGIRAELDMRETSESGGTAAFDNLVTYLNQPIGNYADALSTSSYKSKSKTAIEFIMNCAIQNKPCLFHCAAGADRTGTVAWLLLGLLGVTQSNCDKEYEITSFSGPIRSRATFLGALYTAVNALSGSNFTNKCKNAVLSCGVSLSLINQFRHAMIDGNPTDLEADTPAEPQTQTVSNLKACTRMNWSSSSTSSKAPTNDNTYIALATTVGTLWGFTDRENNSCYVIEVPSWATKVTVSTTDSNVAGYKFRSYTSAGTAVGSADDSNTSGVYTQLSGADCIQITAKYGSESSPWQYDSSQFTVVFTNY